MAGSQLPVIGAMAAVPPALRYRVLDLVARLQHGSAHEPLAALLAEGVGWLGAEPSLAELGNWLVAPARDTETRALGCAWLALFPTIEVIEALAALAQEPAPAVRVAAIHALADRQLRDRHPTTCWTPEAVQLADDTLFKLADAATTEGRVDQLAIPLRHVQSPELSAVFARAPALWGNALECFATPPLARVLAVSLTDMAPAHRVRALRLIAATLGDDAVPLLVGHAPKAATLDERLESLFLAITFGGEAQLPHLEAALADAPRAELARKRARWHLEHRGVVPTVRALRVARSTATLEAPSRAAACGAAADDLAAVARFARHEPYVYELWARLVHAAADPARARELVAAHAGAQRIVRDLYFADLARRGRVKQLVAAAAASPDLGALQLAIWGRPLAALELAATSSRHTPELAAARVLACYRAGRPDLAAAILAGDLPPAAITDDEVAHTFPGPDEQWLAAHATAQRPAIAALVDGLDGVLGLAQPAHHEADPDATSLEPVAAIARRLRRELRGSSVYLAGDFRTPERVLIVGALERAGARIVQGPQPGTDRFIAGDCSPQLIAQLVARGIRRLMPAELEAV